MACVVCTSGLTRCREGDWGLTPREREVLHALCEGHTNAAIAGCLGVRERTAQSHVAKLLLKSGTTSRTHLAVCALRRGEIPWGCGACGRCDRV